VAPLSLAWWFVQVTPIISHLSVKVNSCLDMSDIGYAKLKDVLDQTGIVTAVNILQGQRPEVVMELMQSCMPLPQAVEMLQAMTSGMRLGVVMCAPTIFRERIREQVEAGRGSGSAVSCPNVCPHCSYHADSRHFQLLLQETPEDQVALLAGLDHADLAKLFTAHLHEKEMIFVPPWATKQGPGLTAQKSMADKPQDKPASGKKGSKSQKAVSTQAFADVARRRQMHCGLLAAMSRVGPANGYVGPRMQCLPAGGSMGPLVKENVKSCQ
ncbi:hypothetical protein CYMTET_35020, partial [Cymbomonas tetramitiformis]